jgi:hypothetical protein
MAKRRKGAAPRAKEPTALHVATRTPTAPADVYNTCIASWEIVKGDTAHFPTPFPPAIVMDAGFTTLQTALQDNESGGTVKTAALRKASNSVRHNHHLLGKYVESVVATMPHDAGVALIATVLMFVSTTGKHQPKAELTVKMGSISGLVLLLARAVPGAVSYGWEFSLDQVTWSPGGTTAQAHTTISGLTPGKVYYFRFHAFLRDNTTTNPSQVVNCPVH